MIPDKAMILAAGIGSRLRPLTDTVPKCMVPVNGKPLMEHTIRHLRKFGVRDIVINVCHLRDTIMDYFQDGAAWDVRIRYSVETTPLGTAGAVGNVAHEFKQAFILWYGDNLSNCDLGKLSEFHNSHKAMTTMALFYRPDPTKSGIVQTDQDRRIVRFLEKPGPGEVFSKWVSAGIMIMESAVLDFVPPGISDFGEDVFPILLSNGCPLYGYPLSESEGLWWIDTPEDLQRIQKEFK
jgi:NDP-sugar pyrophosphorylase family protein